MSVRTVLVALSLTCTSAWADESTTPLVLTDHGDGVRAIHQVTRVHVDAGTELTATASPRRLTDAWLVTLAADPALARPRDVNMPVLYVGATPAQVLATDAPTGCVVALLPIDVDVTAEPWFYGSVELPERVGALRGKQERAAALAAGFTARSDVSVSAGITPYADGVALREDARARLTAAATRGCR